MAHFADLDLSERLLIARRGTAYFAQRLAELSDDDFGGDTLLPGWSRRHLVAHVGYNAAALVPADGLGRHRRGDPDV